MAQKNNTKKITIFFIIAICFVIISITAYFFIKDYFKAKLINNEIQILQRQIYDLEDHNIQLTELIKYFDSESFAEKKARTELGLIKKGESVVIVPPTGEEIKNEDVDSHEQDNASNIKKWWNYFFKKNTE